MLNLTAALVRSSRGPLARAPRARVVALPAAARSLSSVAAAAAPPPPREVVEYDVVIVGAGPAGLSAALRLKQRASAAGAELSVCVLEKGAEVGSHILSGNVFEPRALDELVPDWAARGAPLHTKAAEDSFHLLLSPAASVPLPVVPMLHNHGNYVISLGALVRWLGEQAAEAGVDVFTGTPAAEVLYADGREGGAVVGVATADAGIGRDGARKAGYARGMEIRAKQTLVAEGARGSVTEALEARFGLRAAVGADPQTYGLGLKEVWRVPPGRCRPGFIQHTVGWPLDAATYGGSFLYHMAPDLVLVGFVVGLDYADPTLSPYGEFQRWKHHPRVAPHLAGGECVQYGARVINEGGWQAVPKLTFPGGALLGCSAGLLNVPKIKGSHMAMKSGMLAADAVFDALRGPAAAARATADGLEVARYDADVRASWVGAELRAVRNYHPAFKAGQWAGMAYAALSAYALKGREPWTFRNAAPDSAKTRPLRDFPAPRAYPKPDGVLSFDLLTNLARSGVNHEGDQPAHLRVRPGMERAPAELSYATYGGPEARFCPAKVYEYPEPGRLVINAQNCIHCKTCAIKTPGEYIKWTVPEAGGGGPSYSMM